jgi:hypothetical protein
MRHFAGWQLRFASDYRDLHDLRTSPMSIAAAEQVIADTVQAAQAVLGGEIEAIFVLDDIHGDCFAGYAKELEDLGEARRGEPPRWRSELQTSKSPTLDSALMCWCGEHRWRELAVWAARRGTAHGTDDYLNSGVSVRCGPA